MEDAELKTSVDVISLIDNSNVSMSSMSEAEVSESKHGCTSPEMREISALISFKGTLRRKNTDTFASVCSKMAIFKRPENYPKDMQNSLSFHQLIDHIGEASE